MRQNHPVIMHRRSEETKLRRDLGAGRQTRNEGLRSAWKKGRLHAAGNRSLWRVYHPRDYDVLRLDIRNVHSRDRREAAFLAAVSRSAFAESFGEESQVWVFRVRGHASGTSPHCIPIVQNSNKISSRIHENVFTKIYQSLRVENIPRKKKKKSVCFVTNLHCKKGNF